MTDFIYELKSELTLRGVEFIKTIDISMLTEKENRGYNNALLIGFTLSPGFIYRFSKENIPDPGEFFQKEHAIDAMAEWTAEFIKQKGYEAYAQSEKNIIADGLITEPQKRSPLPHKKIALLSGLGWIGKNNLLVTKEFGCAVVICTVLTNAPLPKENQDIVVTGCGGCSVCVDICQSKALHGTVWSADVDRDLMIDISRCSFCLRCLTDCPWTQKYMDENYKN